MGISYTEAAKIVEMARYEIEDHKKYRMLSKGTFQNFWEKRLNKQICFCIYLKATLIDDIDFNKFNKNIEIIDSIITNSNFIELNEFGEVINKNYHSGNSEEIRTKLNELSVENFVFFFGEQGINRYAYGKAIKEVNIFYSYEDRKRFFEKKDISSFENVLQEYATQILTQQVHYMCFFADNSTLSRLGSEYKKRNILKNKPEQLMRDHLKQYLNEHMRYTFHIETELGQSKRELDIYFDVGGEFHFIEVKWLGVCINNNGDGLTQPYGHSRARQGVIQTLEYIKELLNTSETSLRCGYLTIFDARDKKSEIDFQNFKYIEDDLKKYRQNFQLNILPLSKTHPA